MPTSYVDEIVARYLKKKGYLVEQGIWFKIPKEKSGKKVAGWSDIDIWAIKPNESSLVIQCKSSLGVKSSEKVVRDIIKWFEHAIDFLENDLNYKSWYIGKKPKKILVVHDSVKKAEDALKKENIKVWHYDDILKRLLNILMEEAEERENEHIGKEEDVLLRTLSYMLRSGLIRKENLKGGLS